MGFNTNKVNEIITEKVISQLENKSLKWLKDWSQGFGINWQSQKEYNGINALLINIALQEGQYKNNQWLTFNQIKANKGSLRKGAKCAQVIFFNIKEFCSCKNLQCKQKEQEGHLKKKKKSAYIKIL